MDMNSTINQGLQIVNDTIGDQSDIIRQAFTDVNTNNLDLTGGYIKLILCIVLLKLVFSLLHGKIKVAITVLLIVIILFFLIFNTHLGFLTIPAVDSMVPDIMRRLSDMMGLRIY